MSFASQEDAKTFLAQRVIAEAQRQNVVLSEDDRRLLYFSEAEPETVKGISEDRLYADDENYEAKITALLRSAYERDKTGADGPRYKEAATKLHEGDHYLIIMADQALGIGLSPMVGHPILLRNSALYIGIALGLLVVIVVFFFMVFTNR